MMDKQNNNNISTRFAIPNNANPPEPVSAERPHRDYVKPPCKNTQSVHDMMDKQNNNNISTHFDIPNNANPQEPVSAERPHRDYVKSACKNTQLKVPQFHPRMVNFNAFNANPQSPTNVLPLPLGFFLCSIGSISGHNEYSTHLNIGEYLVGGYESGGYESEMEQVD